MPVKWAPCAIYYFMAHLPVDTINNIILNLQFFLNRHQYGHIIMNYYKLLSTSVPLFQLFSDSLSVSHTELL